CRTSGLRQRRRVRAGTLALALLLLGERKRELLVRSLERLDRIASFGELLPRRDQLTRELLDVFGIGKSEDRSPALRSPLFGERSRRLDVIIVGRHVRPPPTRRGEPRARSRSTSRSLATRGTTQLA